MIFARREEILSNEQQRQRRFSWQARVTTMVAGAPGFFLVHAMVAVWLVFTLMLFIAEPLFLHRWFLASARSRPVETFRRIERLHWLLLTISLLTVLGADGRVFRLHDRLA